jgi:hypothetical protein
MRAALLFMRLPQQKGSVSIVQSVVVETDKVVDDMISNGASPTSSAVKGKQPEEPSIAAAAAPATTATTTTTSSDMKTTSWFWALLKWDSLPALPTSFRNRINGVSMSETERSWQPQQQRGRRPGPAFDQPCTLI